ncbi:MAG TPA: RluA family pseudouridine synthase [Fimbriimonadaceae bacterium]|nr:RluA family pseudouridine synthase [Fimbriimonadaceae bacterium]
MILIADGRERLDVFLARHLPQHSRTRLARLINEGGVLVDGSVGKPSLGLEPGMKVSLEEPEPAPPHDLSPADIPLDVRYEDADLLVVNKQRGLAAHPAASLKEPSLVNALLARSHSLSTAGGEFRPGIVHRLDKETTGLMIVAKNDAAHVRLARQIESKRAERRYLAVVAGDVERERFTINAPMARDKRDRMKMAVDPHGKEAVTHIKRIARLAEGTLIAARLETGRTHQIRVHLSAIGHPVLGDTLYAPREYARGPMQLHAAYLGLQQPTTGERIVVYAPPPADFLGADTASEEMVADFYLSMD